MRCHMLAFMMILLASVASAQPGEIRKSMDLDSEVRLLSTDRLGNFYALTRRMLWKIGPEGMVENSRTLPEADSVLMLEAWNPLKVLLHKGGHKFDLLDNDLQSSPESEAIDEALAIDPLLITTGLYTSQMWILDKDGSVKFVDWASQKVLMESGPVEQMTGTAKIHQMRNYQNTLFLLDRISGLYVVGRTGKLVEHVELIGASHLGTLGEDIYFHLPGKLVFIDLYTRDRYDFPVPADVTTAAATDERLLMAAGKRIEIRTFRPKS